MESLAALTETIRACRVCAGKLPLGPRPIFQVHPYARILVAGQAPGQAAHRSGIPFDDASGRRLRQWMGVEEATFYDPRSVAIVPMGFCYPGRGAGGDMPPRPECAPLWRGRLLDALTAIRVTLVIGIHAKRAHLDDHGGAMADAVRGWLDAPNDVVPLPHPSPRNNGWLARNPWFENAVLPLLRQRVRAALEAH